MGPNGIELVTGYDEYFVYSRSYMSNKNTGTYSAQQLKLPKDCISFVHSGLIDETNNRIYGHLHRAIPAANQVRMMESAIVIYRVSRASERRIFYIDCGNLPLTKAQEYVQSVSRNFKNKLVYDSNTGELKDTKQVLSLMEDIFIPRREGLKTTEIDTLPGAENLDKIEDVEFFKRKLYQSLNVPMSRIQSEQSTGFNLGRSAEISRDEVNFSKFVNRLRMRFAHLFYDLLKTQLLLKQIIKEDEWETLKRQIFFDFKSDTYFAELKDAEILRERITTLNMVQPFLSGSGNGQEFFSREFVWKKVLQLHDEDIELMKEQIEKDKEEVIETRENDIETGLIPDPTDIEDPRNGYPPKKDDKTLNNKSNTKSKGTVKNDK